MRCKVMFLSFNLAKLSFFINNSYQFIIYFDKNSRMELIQYYIANNSINLSVFKISGMQVNSFVIV